MHENVVVVDPTSIIGKFNAIYVGCVVLTQDNKILLQQRPMHFKAYPGYLCEFGGKIETDETPQHALVRELQEELGAKVNSKDVVNFGAITELMSQHSELIYTRSEERRVGKECRL